MSASSGTVALFASQGPRLSQYVVDAGEGALLDPRDLVRLPENVQYACGDATGRCLYVVSSDGGPGAAGNVHRMSAFRIDWTSRVLRPNGEPVPLRHRPIHITVDATAEHVLITYNAPSSVTVHRIRHDGRVGAEMAQPTALDTGVFAHQACIAPNNRIVIVVARGDDATADAPEKPGALKVFTYRRGSLAERDSVAPGGGYGFGPRNIEFSPSAAWAYVSLERQNRLDVFRVEGDTLAAEPAFRCETLLEPKNVHSKQMAGAVHVHPSGRFVYLANRAFGTTEYRGRRVFAGGENSIVVYAIDDRTGRPQMIQRIDTQGIYPRTFSIDPCGRMLVVGNLRPLLVRVGEAVAMTPANLSVFSIEADGRLTHLRRHDLEDGREELFWSGMVCHPAARSSTAEDGI